MRRVIVLYNLLVICLVRSIASSDNITTTSAVHANQTTEPDALISIIPKPKTLKVGSGSFKLDSKTTLNAAAGCGIEAGYFAAALAPAMGFTPQVREAQSTAPAQNAISLQLDPDAAKLGNEGYRLVVETTGVSVTAYKPAGIFYACQTIRQLLPPEVFSSTRAGNVEWKIPCVTIEDQPRFQYRGLLLDVGRHFFPVEDLKHSIDLMALHKLNRFHMHLTDDQGWRLEIRRYPRLTEVGAWRTENGCSRYGGFYTQEQMRAVIAYAAERHITIIPEIEMPSHSMSALTSYPFLGCTGGPYNVQNNWGIFPDVFCPGKETTFQFIENVLDEVMELFPSRFIHIGGDECNKERWSACPLCQERKRKNGLKDEHELQSYFIRRLDTFLAGRGRRLVGWDEILEGGLAPGAVVQSWRGTQGGIVAASAGHDVVMSPNTHCYLDHSYEIASAEKAYGYEPIPPELPQDKARHVLGVEGTMWTEWVKNQARCDFMVYPRMTSLAEVGWSPKEGRSYEEFKPRLDAHSKRFAAMGVVAGFPDNITTAGGTRIGTWRAGESKPDGFSEWNIPSITGGARNLEAFVLPEQGEDLVPVEWMALIEEGKEVQRDAHHGRHGAPKRNNIYRFKLNKSEAAPKFALKVRFSSEVQPSATTPVHVYIRAIP